MRSPGGSIRSSQEIVVVVGAMLIRLHLPACQSLKEKRQVVKSLVARLANQFGVSAAEVAELDTWQIAALGVSCVSNEVYHAEQVLDAALRFVEETRPDVDVLDVAREVARLFE
jgi:uncharacterized protein YlxP (DUF503 family)